MQTYRIKTTTVVHTWYMVEAENKKEARKILLSGEAEQPDEEDCNVYSVDVDTIEEVQRMKVEYSVELIDEVSRIADALEILIKIINEERENV